MIWFISTPIRAVTSSAVRSQRSSRTPQSMSHPTPPGLTIPPASGSKAATQSAIRFSRLPWSGARARRPFRVFRPAGGEPGGGCTATVIRRGLTPSRPPHGSSAGIQTPPTRASRVTRRPSFRGSYILNLGGGSTRPHSAATAVRRSPMSPRSAMGGIRRRPERWRPGWRRSMPRSPSSCTRRRTDAQ
jgi:hypothetical protein